MPKKDKETGSTKSPKTTSHFRAYDNFFNLTGYDPGAIKSHDGQSRDSFPTSLHTQ